MLRSENRASIGLFVACLFVLGACSSSDGVRCSFASPARLAKSSWPKFQRDAQNTGAIASSEVIRAPVVRAQFRDPGGGQFLTAPVLGNGEASERALDRRVYIGGSSGELFALESTTLTQLPPAEFSFSITARIQTTPLVGTRDGQEVLFFGSELGFLYGIAQNAGRLQTVWPLNTGGATGLAVGLSPTDGTVYVTSTARALYGVCPNGVARFASSSVAPVISAPALTPTGDIVYGGEDRILRMERGDGFLLWSLSLSAPLRNAPLIELEESDPSKAKAVYAVDNSGQLFKVSPGGTLMYARSLTGDAEPSVGKVAGSPALANGRLYIGTTAGALLAIDADSGQVMWSLPVGAEIVASPVVLVHERGQTVVIGTMDGELFFIEDGTQEPGLMWRVSLGGAIRHPVAVSAPTGGSPVFFVADDSGTISRLE